MRFIAQVTRPTYTLDDGRTYYMVLEKGTHFCALTMDEALANWIAGAGGSRVVVKVEPIREE